jgi:hypothetical protein
LPVERFESHVEIGRCSEEDRNCGAATRTFIYFLSAPLYSKYVLPCAASMYAIASARLHNRTEFVEVENYSASASRIIGVFQDRRRTCTPARRCKRYEKWRCNLVRTVIKSSSSAYRNNLQHHSLRTLRPFEGNSEILALTERIDSIRVASQD